MNAPASTTHRHAPLAVVVTATLLVGFLAGLGISRRAAWPAPSGGAGGGQPLFAPPVAGSRAGGTGAALDGSLSAVAGAVMPAVVNISSTRVVRSQGVQSPIPDDPFLRRFFGEDPFHQFRVPRERREQSLGSGVIVTADGYVMTNNHVIAGADTATVTLSDRREFKARVVGTDPKTDVAVLKLDAGDLPHLPLGDSDRTEVGEIVLAVGSPFGLKRTVTMGIISAKGRANMGIADYEDFIQTDAAINPGNSGGALVNTRGELIGINTAIASRTGGYEGIGFAIPSNMAKSVSEDLIKHGKVTRGMLGVSIQEVTPALAEVFHLKEARGALVGDVTPGSPADRGGLKRGDVIVEYEGREVEDSAQLRLWVARTQVGHTARLVIQRDGKRVPLQVTIAELREHEEEEGATGGAEEDAAALAGVQVQELTAAVARRLGLPRDVRGVVVTDVNPASAAAEADLQQGDVIREVNRKPTTTLSAFRSAVRAAGRGPVVLLVQRGGSAFYVTIR
jgi:serine protease Do